MHCILTITAEVCSDRGGPKSPHQKVHKMFPEKKIYVKAQYVSILVKNIKRLTKNLSVRYHVEEVYRTWHANQLAPACPGPKLPC